MTRTSRTALAAVALFAIAGAILLAMGRPPICTCGHVSLWGPSGPTQSQMLTDWYSLSHVVHGLLFYAAGWLALKRWPVQWRFLLAIAVEAAWEVVENTPMVIDHYRSVTVSLGYVGDSAINSISDIAMMVLGFFAARKLSLWASLLFVVVLELIPLLVIRDNLTLNVWMFLAPNQDILAWQSAG